MEGCTVAVKSPSEMPIFSEAASALKTCSNHLEAFSVVSFGFNWETISPNDSPPGLQRIVSGGVATLPLESVDPVLGAGLHVVVEHETGAKIDNGESIRRGVGSSSDATGVRDDVNAVGSSVF